MKIAPITAAVALAALLVAGCGGDNKGAVTATSSSGAPATTAASSAGASTTDSGSSSGSTTTPSFEGNSNNDFCQTARSLEGSDVAGVLSGTDGDLKTTLQELKSALDKLKGSAPSEIKDDVSTLASAFEKLDSFYANYNYDQAQVIAAAQKDPSILQEATSFATDAEFQAAAGRVSAYGAQVCGIEAEDSVTTSA